MDFTWVKQLAEQTNQQETQRVERERRDKEEKKTIALANNPFVEKLHLVISGASEEFNKNCIYPHLRIQSSKLYRHSRTGEASTAEPDEVSYFTFFRKGIMYGVRGINGIVEFVQVPVGDSLSGISIKLHEMGVSPSKTMTATIEPETKKIRWTIDGQPLDGPAIVSLCQKFFIDFIQETNKDDDQKQR